MIRPLTADDLAWVLELNRTLEVELSPLTAESLETLVATAFCALVADPRHGFLIALDRHADYRSPNFLWLRSRFAAFVYVDRVAVAAAARGRGLASALYAELFRVAVAAGRRRIVCEVNLAPPNPASDAFHARLGFAEVGHAQLDGGKVVRYLSRSL